VPVGRHFSGRALSFGLSDSAVTGNLVSLAISLVVGKLTPLSYLIYLTLIIPSQIFALYSLVDMPPSTLFASLLLHIVCLGDSIFTFWLLQLHLGVCWRAAITEALGCGSPLEDRTLQT
jgi:hypothetical protein